MAPWMSKAAGGVGGKQAESRVIKNILYRSEEEGTETCTPRNGVRRGARRKSFLAITAAGSEVLSDTWVPPASTASIQICARGTVKLGWTVVVRLLHSRVVTTRAALPATIPAVFSLHHRLQLLFLHDHSALPAEQARNSAAGPYVRDSNPGTGGKTYRL